MILPKPTGSIYLPVNARYPMKVTDLHKTTTMQNISDGRISLNIRPIQSILFYLVLVYFE